VWIASGLRGSGARRRRLDAFQDQPPIAGASDADAIAVLEPSVDARLSRQCDAALLVENGLPADPACGRISTERTPDAA
jgi:hypothetical protein